MAGKSGAWWGTNPTKFGEGIHAEVYKLTRKTAIQVFQAAVVQSPVDSGAFRASWHISEGYPEYRWVGRHRKLSGAGKTPLPPPPVPITGLSTRFYRRFYVTNGAPYALRLEQGWSDQAPYGIIRSILRYGV